MERIKFSKEEKEIITRKIQMYFNDELDQKIGQFDTEFLLDFFSEEIGSYFYNRGLIDAQAVLDNKLEDISTTLYELEKPTEFSR